MPLSIVGAVLQRIEGGRDADRGKRKAQKRGGETGFGPGIARDERLQRMADGKGEGGAERKRWMSGRPYAASTASRASRGNRAR